MKWRRSGTTVRSSWTNALNRWVSREAGSTTGWARDSLLTLSIIFIPLERLWALHPQKIFRREVWHDVSYYVLNSLVVQVLLIVPMAVAAWSLHAAVPAALRNLASGLPYGERFPIALVVGEIGPVIGTHCGPGAVGVAILPAD